MYRPIIEHMRETGTASDSQLLKISLLLHKGNLNYKHEATQERVALNRDLREKSENGMIALVSGGMDCDCCTYEGHISLIPANLKAYDEAIDEMYRWAEGPIHWELQRPSEASLVKPESRDLALEAFENGHPWSITH